MLTCFVGVDISEGTEEALINFEDFLICVCEFEGGFVLCAEHEGLGFHSLSSGLRSQKVFHFIVDGAYFRIEVTHWLALL